MVTIKMSEYHGRQYMSERYTKNPVGILAVSNSHDTRQVEYSIAESGALDGEKLHILHKRLIL